MIRCGRHRVILVGKSLLCRRRGAARRLEMLQGRLSVAMWREKPKRYILQQMRKEFPSVMVNVHYRVLKKKWSNLLQQYKELKNPVHGDRNKAGDVSWPFYGPIDEVVGQIDGTLTNEGNEEYIDPHEFLCVSVTPEEATSSNDALPLAALTSNTEIEGARGPAFLSASQFRSTVDQGSVRIERIPQAHEHLRINRGQSKRKRDSRTSRVISPRVVDPSIEKFNWSNDTSRVRSRNVMDSCRNKGQTTRNEDEKSTRKSRRTRISCHESRESLIDRRIDQIFEYTKRRDEEHRSVMVRIMHAVESIASKL